MKALLVLLTGCTGILGIDERDPAGDDEGGTANSGNHCEGVPDTCGGESCCTAFGVPGGQFKRENSSTWPATLSGYVLDKYKVTVGRFRKFVEAGYGNQMMPPADGSGEHPNLPGSGWDPAWNATLKPSPGLLKLSMRSAGCANGTLWSDDPADKENRPINCVSWVTAMAFCIWDGGYLPTFAEWQFAAAGGDDQRMYPWGFDAPDPTRAVYGVSEPADVGTKPAGNGRYGHSDLVGNLRELVLDYAWGFELQLPCDDCAQIVPNEFTTRQVVGSSCNADVASLTIAGVNGLGVGDNAGFGFAGFRCARPVN